MNPPLLFLSHFLASDFYRRTFNSWVVYFIAVLYIACVLGSYGYAYFSLFLKSLENPDGTKVWNTAQVNAIPIGGGAIQVVFGKIPQSTFKGTITDYSKVWIWALLSDYFGTRWTLIVAQGKNAFLAPPSCTLTDKCSACIGSIPCIIMSIWTRYPESVALSAAYASYFISYLALGTAPLIMSWLSDL